MASKLTFLARRVISWSAILTSSWMRRNDENTGVLVNSCQLGNNDVVDASWRKYVARPLHFFPSLSLPLPLSSSLFAKSHWEPTGISFAIIRAQFARKPWNRFLRDAAGWLFPYFAFFASFIVAAGWTREIRGRRIFVMNFVVMYPMIYAWNRGFNGDLGIPS